MPYIQQDDWNDRKGNKDAMEVIDRYHLDGLKRKKTQAKAACTRTRAKLMALMDSDLPSRTQIREASQKIDDAQQVALEIMGEIADEFKSYNNLRNVQKVIGEMEDIGHRKSSSILAFKKRWSIKYHNNKLIRKKYQ